MSVVANLLHISDLHFIEDLTERGKKLWVKRLGPRSHAFAKVSALSRALHREPVDELIVATGDLSTDGTRQSLATVRTFVEANEVRIGPTQRLITYGLAAPVTQHLFLPGNHDRFEGPVWIQQTAKNINLEEVFSSDPKYPYLCGYRKNDYQGSAAVVFFVFDSTPSETAVEGWKKAPHYHIARGRIEPGECDWLIDESRSLACTPEVKCLGSSELIRFDPASAIRVVLVHHHPVPTNIGGKMNPATLMENNSDFVAACLEAKIDIVLFGHEHVSYIAERTSRSTGHCTRFFCCPTTTEAFGPDTGFYRFMLGEHNFTLAPYNYNGKSFIKGSPLTFSYTR